MANTYHDLFIDSELADIIFVMNDEEVFGHRVIFGIACDYFKKLLYGDFKESKSKHIEISGTSAKLFLEVKRFIYLGNLEIANWTMDDLLGLLSLAHAYQYHMFFTEVTKAVEVKPMDFDSWKLVQTAASVYDSEALRSKCTSFAEDKMKVFLRLEDLEKFTFEFICFMFESPKISMVNQDQLLRAICNWKLNKSKSEIMPLFPKICWENVSPAILAVMVKEFFSLNETDDECRCWNHTCTVMEEALKYVFSIDDLVLTWRRKEFEVAYHQCLLCCELQTKYIQLRFQKDNSMYEIPIKKIEWETANHYNIARVYGLSKDNGEIDMVVVSVNTAIENRFKYSANLTKATTVVEIRILSSIFNFNSNAEMKFYNLVIS